MIVTTTNEVAGHRVVRQWGVVRGITVRSRSALSNIGANIQAVFGGKISIFVELERDAFRLSHIRRFGNSWRIRRV